MPKKLKWSWKEEVTPEVFLKRIADEYCAVMESVMDMDGDMYMSDYRKLLNVYYQLKKVEEND